MIHVHVIFINAFVRVSDTWPAKFGYITSMLECERIRASSENQIVTCRILEVRKGHLPLQHDPQSSCTTAPWIAHGGDRQ